MKTDFKFETIGGLEETDPERWKTIISSAEGLQNNEAFKFLVEETKHAYWVGLFNLGVHDDMAVKNRWALSALQKLTEILDIYRTLHEEDEEGRKIK